METMLVPYKREQALSPSGCYRGGSASATMYSTRVDLLHFFGLAHQRSRCVTSLVLYKRKRT